MHCKNTITAQCLGQLHCSNMFIQPGWDLWQQRCRSISRGLDQLVFVPTLNIFWSPVGSEKKGGRGCNGALNSMPGEQTLIVWGWVCFDWSSTDWLSKEFFWLPLLEYLCYTIYMSFVFKHKLLLAYLYPLNKFVNLYNFFNGKHQKYFKILNRNFMI